jgi:ferredoxin
MTAPEEQTSWSVQLDRFLCIGSGMCVATAPDRFHLVDSRADVVDAGPVEPDEILLDAADACPAEAIRVLAAGTLLAPRP